MSLCLPDFDLTQWAVLCLCAVLVGINKTGMPGLGALNVPLLAMMFSAKASTGLLLLLLAFGDIFAVIYYRRHARWGHVFRLMPWTLAGVGVGTAAIRQVDDLALKPVIGIMVLTLLAANLWRIRHKSELAFQSHWAFVALMGLLAGVFSQLANAAGPIIVLYLVVVGLPKQEFIGTGAWYYLILNWIKIPLFISEGRIGADSLTADLIAGPFVVLGAVLGIYLVKRIPRKGFTVVVQILTALAAVQLIASMLWTR